MNVLNDPNPARGGLIDSRVSAVPDLPKYEMTYDELPEIVKPMAKLLQEVFGVNVYSESAVNDTVNGVINSDKGSKTGDETKDDTKETEERPWYQDILDVLNNMVSTNEEANKLASLNARNAQNFESREAQKARDWYEQMENTYVQRRVADLEAAGLNKWMAMSGNFGNTGASSASSASGHTAQTFKSDGSLEEYLIPVILQFAGQILSGVTSAAQNVGSFFSRLFGGS